MKSLSRAAVLAATLLLGVLYSGISSAEHTSYAIRILETSTSPLNRGVMTLIGNKDYKGLRQLIANQTRVNEADNKGCRPIHYAAYMGSVEAVKLFMEYKVDLKASTFGNWTALHYAALAGHLDVVDFLVSAGVPIDVVDAGGESPMFYAVEYGHAAVVQWLVTHGANVNHENRKGETPLSVAEENGNKRLIGYLQMVGAKGGRGAHNEYAPEQKGSE